MRDLFKKAKEKEDMNIGNEQVKPKEIIEDNEEWIWVEGYKVLHENPSTGEFFGYNNCVFELNKEYECQGEIKECDNGFHFCKNLIDVKNYYNPLCECMSITSVWYNLDFCKIKHFKVKAYVKKNDWDKQCDKYVAKKIILTEQVLISEIWDIFDIDEICIKGYCIKTFEDFELFHSEISVDAFIDILKQREFDNNIKLLTSKGYSNTFSMLLSKYHKDKIEKAIAYADEDLSVDMRAYLLLKGKQYGNSK